MNVGINWISMAEFQQILPLVLPIIAIQLILAVVAIKKIIKQEDFRYLNKVSWVLIVLLLQLIGPIAYFVLGRSED